MRGNKLARGGDPMKTRSQKRREKKEKLDKTKRVQRLKKRLGRITAKKFAAQQDSHTTALMESYILRRKAERAAEKKKTEEEAAAKRKLEEGGSSEDDAPYTNEDLYNLYEDEVFADDNPRAQHKRMKDLMKGIRPDAASTSHKRGANDQRASSHPDGSKGSGKLADKPTRAARKEQTSRKPNGRGGGGTSRYDQRNKRVQTRSLY